MMKHIRITILVIFITTIVAALTLATLIAYQNKFHKKMVVDLPEEYPLITKDKKYPDLMRAYQSNDTIYISFLTTDTTILTPKSE